MEGNFFSNRRIVNIHVQHFLHTHNIPSLKGTNFEKKLLFSGFSFDLHDEDIIISNILHITSLHLYEYLYYSIIIYSMSAGVVLTDNGWET